MTSTPSALQWSLLRSSSEFVREIVEVVAALLMAKEVAKVDKGDVMFGVRDCEHIK